MTGSLTRALFQHKESIYDIVTSFSLEFSCFSVAAVPRTISEDTLSQVIVQCYPHSLSASPIECNNTQNAQHTRCQWRLSQKSLRNLNTGNQASGCSIRLFCKAKAPFTLESLETVQSPLKAFCKGAKDQGEEVASNVALHTFHRCFRMQNNVLNLLISTNPTPFTN